MMAVASELCRGMDGRMMRAFCGRPTGDKGPPSSQMDGANMQATKPFLLALLNLVKRNLNMNNTGMRKFSKENYIPGNADIFQ